MYQSLQQVGNFADVLGNRVCVIGMGGKTSLSQALGSSLGLDVLHLDEVCWMPNWTLRDKADQLRIIREWVAEHPDGWVADGNLNRDEAALLLAAAETVIWLHMPHLTTWFKVTWRSFQRALRKKRVCGDNYESFPHILGRDSMIWWSLFYWHERHRKVRDLLAGFDHSATVVRLDSYRELNAAYESIGADAAIFRAP